MSQEAKNAAETESDVGAALVAGAALGNVRKNPHKDGRDFVVVPDAHKVEYLERPTMPVRLSGAVTLSDTDSFLEYVNRFKSESMAVYGSLSPAQFVAIFNAQTKDAPNWGDHKALFPLVHSPEWAIWTHHSDKPFNGNEAFAVWLENNMLDIIDPAPAKMMDIALNIKINQKQSFGSAVRLQDGNIEFTYSNLVEGQAKNAANRPVTIPDVFKIQIPVFQGQNAARYTVEARFRYRLEGDSIKIRYELVRPTKIVEKAFYDILGVVNKGAKTTVLFGAPNAA